MKFSEKNTWQTHCQRTCVIKLGCVDLRHIKKKVVNISPELNWQVQSYDLYVRFFLWHVLIYEINMCLLRLEFNSHQPWTDLTFQHSYETNLPPKRIMTLLGIPLKVTPKIWLWDVRQNVLIEHDHLRSGIKSFLRILRVPQLPKVACYPKVYQPSGSVIYKNATGNQWILPVHTIHGFLVQHFVVS